MGHALTHLMFAQCTTDARGSHGVHATSARRAPAANCCAEKLGIAAIYLHSNNGMAHCGA